MLGMTLMPGRTRLRPRRKLDEVRRIFRRKGAFKGFKVLLQDEGVLQQWYDYRDRREQEALDQWCRDHGLDLESDRRAE
jgi:hypothetical protein